MKTFEELGISSNILKAITEMGYKNPMPVQEKVIPYLLKQGNEIIALAATGTGKTAAFGIPILQQIQICCKHPQAIILCPTRELCLQITNDINNYSKYLKQLKILSIYGGSNIENQIKILQRGIHIIVATPGRLIDLINRKIMSLQHIDNIVLDEADEMLSMGFYKSIDKILSHLPDNKNMLLFSATMPTKIAQITKKYMNNPREIIIGGKNSIAKNIQHKYYIINNFNKYILLKRLIDYHPNIYGIIFCRTKYETQKIANLLIKDGYNADSLHGDLSQIQRDYVMQKFRLHNIQLLVATDVAARGLDVIDLSHIINYNLPDDVESYIHRSGRTGRAEKIGISITFIHSKEKYKIIGLEKNINKTFKKETIPSGIEIYKKQFFYFIEKLEKITINDKKLEDIFSSIYCKLDYLSKEDIIKRLILNEFNHLIKYYQNPANEIQILQNKNKHYSCTKTIFNFKKNKQTYQKKYTRLYINLGKVNGLIPSKLIKLLNDNVLGYKIDIRKINLMEKFSFFEVKNIDKQRIIQNLSCIKAFGKKISIENSKK